MKNILDTLAASVQKAFELSGYDFEFGNISYSDRADLCDFQCNGCFPAAKKYKKSPIVIAEEVVKHISTEYFSSIEIVQPGFLNFKVKDEILLNSLNHLSQDKNSLFPNVGTNQTVIIDYGGANVAKPLHIGHLRSAVIGEAIKRITKAGGYTVISDVHLGDWGLQMGLVITELRELYPDLSNNLEKIKNFEIQPSILNEIYPKASIKSKEFEEYRKNAQSVTAALQSNELQTKLLWEKIMACSRKDLEYSYNRLQVNFDYWYGESDASLYIPTLLNSLTSKNLLEDSDGAKVVRVSTDEDLKEIPPVIIVKSDGSSIYATTDLATIIQRMKDFSPSKIWYVVDKRQNLHFTQVFRVAEKAKLITENTELEFLGFGTMNGTDGKPYKTRDGGVMQLNSLLDSAILQAKNKITRDNFTSDSELEDAAEKIAIAAIKFGDLINYRSKDYVFDIDKFLSFEGKTGPYILYSITRINSILNKIDLSSFKEEIIHGIHSESEKNLILSIVKCPEIHLKSLNEKSPNLVAESAYQIAVLFSKFYAHNNILLQEDKEIQRDWINLLRIVKNTLEFQLNLLGIESVSKM